MSHSRLVELVIHIDLVTFPAGQAKRRSPRHLDFFAAQVQQSAIDVLNVTFKIATGVLLLRHMFL
ncbi:hypothetical protein WI96_18245 [Burkholderia vietnamiensis]|nr:hypothetical protein WI96_18245 [Burkholderia vietnamiensis]